jgi:hypothetical protein
MTINIARRKFITVLGGTVFGSPLAVRAQPPAMSVVGFLHYGLPGPHKINYASAGYGKEEREKWLPTVRLPAVLPASVFWT